MKKNECELTIDECMNLGKFYNKNERALNRKWKPIEKALIEAQKLKLIHFEWIFKEVSATEKIKFETNLFGEIARAEYNDNGTLKEEYYKHIAKVKITRIYELNAPSIKLPFDLENKNAINPNMKVGFEI